MTDDSRENGKAAACPLCGKPAAPRFQPFCSERCKMRDLARWIGADEPYAIAGEPMVGLVDENGEPLIDLDDLIDETGEESDPDNVVYADFTRKSGRRNG